MNTQSTKTDKFYIKFICLTVSILMAPAGQAWDVDFSRRQNEFSKIRNQNLLLKSAQEPKSLFQAPVVSSGPILDIVVLNTEKGFVPETIQLKKDQSYRLHVVNIHPQEKNLSFVMEAFSEFHGTIFGQQKTFQITPKIDGLFTYQCPETGYEGQLVVVSESSFPVPQRSPLPNLKTPKKSPQLLLPLSEPLTLRAPAQQDIEE